jgi:hypothetical protein
MGTSYTRRYTAKVAELSKSDLIPPPERLESSFWKVCAAATLGLTVFIFPAV